MKNTENVVETKSNQHEFQVFNHRNGQLEMIVTGEKKYLLLIDCFPTKWAKFRQGRTRLSSNTLAHYTTAKFISWSSLKLF